MPASRAFYSQLLPLPPLGGALFHAILDLEEALAAALAPATPAPRPHATAAAAVPLTRAAVLALYECAIEAYGGEDVELWLRLARTEGPEGAGRVHWRATHALIDPAPFVAAARVQAMAT